MRIRDTASRGREKERNGKNPVHDVRMDQNKGEVRGVRRPALSWTRVAMWSRLASEYTGRTKRKDKKKRGPITRACLKRGLAKGERKKRTVIQGHDFLQEVT